MPANVAQRRARKAMQRRAVLAERRKAEAQVSVLLAQIRLAATTPIRHCLIQEALFDVGIGTLILARGATLSDFSVGVFLLDTYCLGIKDVFFRLLDAGEFEAMIEEHDVMRRLIDVNPSDARALLGDLAVWSRSIGFAPHLDFAAVEQLFGDVNADDSTTAFTFGRNGKPFYVPGPSDPPNLVHARFAQLRRYLGTETIAPAPTDEAGDTAVGKSN